MTRYLPLLAGLLLLLLAVPSLAQMVSGDKMPGYDTTLGLTREQKATAYTAQYISATIPANVLWPGEQAAFTFQLTNTTNEPIAVKGKVDVIAFGTKGRPGDIWVPDMYKIADVQALPLEVNLAAKGYANLTVTPTIPPRFGAYALVADLGQYGRAFITSCIRTFKADPKPVQFPQLCLDNHDPTLLSRLGAAPNRMGIGYKPTTDKDFEKWYKDQGDKLMAYKAAGLAITVEIGGGAFQHENQPLGRQRPWLDDNGVMKETKFDLAWLPSWDADFRKFCKMIAADYGWPKGPINGMKLWNEPWNGISISGWGADDERYREIYTTLCEGVEEARKEAGVQVLLGGCDSSSNTFDKLFADGTDRFLQRLDFCSIHYQGMNPPSTVKAWVNRQSPYGRVQIWDTESWVANTDDRVAAVVATNLSTGHDRAVGVFGGNIASEGVNGTIRDENGKPKRITCMHAWSVGAAVTAVTHFIGERKFKELLFKNGLPWVMVFNGQVDAKGKANPEDGTVVVVGDIGDEFGHDGLLFRSARSTQEILHKTELKRQLAALPATATDAERQKLEAAIKAPETRTGCVMTLKAQGKAFSLFDFYGNPVPAQGGKIIIPLDGRGYFLRADGKKGSFAKLLKALQTADVTGIEPLATVCHDLTKPIEQHPTLRLSLTNVLPKPVTGTLTVSLGGLVLDKPTQKLTINGNETKDVLLTVVDGKAAPDNNYPLALTFDAGKAGIAVHEETMRVNYVAKRRIAVDGKLDDWNGALPQIISVNEKSGPTITEHAWQPFLKFDDSVKKGFATGYLAYDEQNFYFAAKVADSTPEDGMLRFETRDEEQYFYPEISYLVDAKKAIMKEDTSWTAAETNPALTVAPLDPVKPNTRLFQAWRTKLTATTFGFDVKLPADRALQLAVYCVDFDDMERRAQQLEVVDLDTNKSLLTKDFDKFQRGKYVVLAVRGNVRVLVRTKMWWFPVMQAVFFDPTTEALPGAGTAAKFLRFDETTGGNWKAQYGKDGYLVVGAEPKFPAYAQVAVIDESATTQLKWPDGVRRYSYRKGPELPSGNSPNHDNIQVAFNVLPADQKAWYPCPPGTMPGYIGYRDTDYEYALNPVAAQYGGGVEIWRLQYPDMPHKHFYPRSPKSPQEGAVKDGKLVVVRDGNTRIVECALPWSEIPEVKKALDAGKPIKFSYRVNDNTDAGCMELSKDRSVAKRNGSFMVDWKEHWANELEFGFEK